MSKKISTTNRTLTHVRLVLLMQEKATGLVCFFVLFVVILGNTSQGIVWSPDSYTYARWADKLIAVDFSYTVFLKEVEFFTPLIFYLLPVTIIALAKTIFGHAWPIAIIVVNYFCLAGCLLFFVASARKLAVRAGLIQLGLLLTLFGVDFYTWPHFILSDMFSVLLVMASLHFAISAAMHIHWKNWLMLASLLFLLLVSRPSSPAIIIGILAVCAIYQLPLRVCAPRYFLLAVFSGVILITLFYGKIFHEITAAGDWADNPQTSFILKNIGLGTVIHDRPETYMNPASLDSALGVSSLYLTRFYYFFVPWSHSFSFAHNVFNTIFFVPLALTVCVAVIWAARNLSSRPENLNQDGYRAILGIIVLVLGVALYHSLVLIDYDWRYRFPVCLPMLIFSVLVVEQFLRSNEQEKGVKT